MSNYPIHIITDYRAGIISRQQFIKSFSDWQKTRGIDYDCKGTVQHGIVCITYRGVHAIIRDGVIYYTGTYTDKNGNHHYIRKQAQSIREFEHKVDIAICGRLRSLA